MNLLHLKYFFTVANAGSFSRASQLLKIDQSALSRMVKQFETSLDAVLLERHPRGVVLTREGQNVLTHAERIFAEVDALQKTSGESRQVCSGELTMATTDLIASRIFAKATTALIERWPLVYPVVHVGTPAETLPLIVGSACEFGVFFHLPHIPSSLAVTKRWPVRFHLVCAASAHRKQNVLNNFIGSREVDDRLNRRFPTLAKWKTKQPLAKIGISSNSLLLHLDLVRSGVGISVLPDFLVQKDLRAGRLRDLLAHERLVFDLKLIQRKNVALSRNAAAFLEQFESAVHAPLVITR